MDAKRFKFFTLLFLFFHRFSEGFDGMLGIPPNNHGVQPQHLIGPTETRAKRGKLLTTIPRLSTEWSWSLNYRIFGTIADWGNILKCDSKNGAFTFGDRIPALAILPNSNYRISTGSSIDNIHDYVFDIGQPSDFNKTNHVEIHHRYISNGDYRYYIIHNGQEVHSKIVKTYTQFYNVKCWLFSIHDPPVSLADIYISNVIFTNFL